MCVGAGIWVVIACRTNDHLFCAGRGLQLNAIKLSFFVGWVERSETHRTYENGGFRSARVVYQLFREIRGAEFPKPSR
jgi:hypothetical protein